MPETGNKTASTKQVAASFKQPDGVVQRFGQHCPMVLKGETEMVLTTAHIAPLTALIAGILILVMPRLLNFVVAIYLIIVGLVGLNGIYHFLH
jgi:hypothetical protein